MNDRRRHDVVPAPRRRLRGQLRRRSRAALARGRARGRRAGGGRRRLRTPARDRARRQAVGHARRRGARRLFYGSGRARGAGARRRGGLAGGGALLGGARRRRRARAAAHWDAIESHWLVPCALAALAAAPARRHARLRAFGRRRAARTHAARARDRSPPRARPASTSASSAPSCGRGSRARRRRRLAVGAVEPLRAAAVAWSRRAGVADAALRRELGLARPTVLAVGRLVPIKGHDRLLRACGRVQAERAAGDALEVVILGDGPERERLGRLAAELGVHLRLPGFVAARATSRAGCAPRTSTCSRRSACANGRTEGAPLATAEARAVGLPVLVEDDPVALRPRSRPISAPGSRTADAAV